RPQPPGRYKAVTPPDRRTGYTVRRSGTAGVGRTNGMTRLQTLLGTVLALTACAAAAQTPAGQPDAKPQPGREKADRHGDPLPPVHAMHAAFAPDGKTLATADYERNEGHIRLWDLATGQDRMLAVLPSYANGLAFDPTGKRLFATVHNHSLRCWDVASGKMLW